MSLPVEKVYGRQCLSDIITIERDLVPPNLGDIVSLDTVRQEKYTSPATFVEKLLMKERKVELQQELKFFSFLKQKLKSDVVGWRWKINLRSRKG